MTNFLTNSLYKNFNFLPSSIYYASSIFSQTKKAENPLVSDFSIMCKTIFLRIVVACFNRLIYPFVCCVYTSINALMVFIDIYITFFLTFISLFPHSFFPNPALLSKIKNTYYCHDVNK